MKATIERFTGRAGLTIFVRRWHPERPSRATIVLAHGYAEHSGRYAHVARRLTAAGYTVWAPDHRGHGRSEGARAYVERFEHYVADLGTLDARIERAHPERPRFLLGHSMGALIALWMAAEREDPLAGIVTSGVALQLQHEVSPVLMALSGLLDRLTPWLPVVDIADRSATRNKQAVRRFREDPLCYHGRVRVRTGLELQRAGDALRARLDQITAPLLALHGTADSFAAPAGSHALCRHAGSADCWLRLYRGLRHEVLNEPERARVLDDVVAWLDARATNPAGGT